MIAMANAGYRAVAFDFRGYGLSDHPPEPERANFNDLADDVLALLDSLAIDKAFLVGKDFGAFPAFTVAVTHPERVLGVITLGVPFLIPGPLGVQFDLLPKGYYVIRWAEPGRAEADFGRFDVKTVVRNIYILFCRSELQVAGDNEEIMDLVELHCKFPTGKMASYEPFEPLTFNLVDNSSFLTLNLGLMDFAGACNWIVV
ncbi:hypothetical protein Gohar_020740 [Gossypium harknessii]|uniref:AB hydrolase-1 domain-containing protein n=1 Tax=Gossypium harknessii TaxID=34285 RepID=A0A7J9HYL1_9ROSI|nr:hypothetical protein [Gossypium harknessii]